MGFNSAFKGLIFVCRWLSF